jgi:hypothetical protein
MPCPVWARYSRPVDLHAATLQTSKGNGLRKDHASTGVLEPSRRRNAELVLEAHDLDAFV